MEITRCQQDVRKPRGTRAGKRPSNNPNQSASKGRCATSAMHHSAQTLARNCTGCSYKRRRRARSARPLMALQERLVLMLRSPRRWRICAAMTWGVAGLFSCGAQTGRRHHPKDMRCYRLPVLMGPFLLGPKLAQIQFQMHEATRLVSCWANPDPNRTNKKMMRYRIISLHGPEWIQIRPRKTFGVTGLLSS